MRILGIDPGNKESAFVIIDGNYKPIRSEKVSNEKLLEYFKAGDFDNINYFSIEMIASYGMPTGATIFETCLWIGRFIQEINTRYNQEPTLIYREDEKLNICKTKRAKDSNIIQALCDRFAPGEANRGKGNKLHPGWFYGFKSDIWQSYAVAITFLDMIKGFYKKEG